MFNSKVLRSVVSIVVAGTLVLVGCEKDGSAPSLTSVGEPASLSKEANVAAQLAAVRGATAQYHRVAAAQAADYGLVPGLDHCFNLPGVGGMGYHYISVSDLDTVVNLLKPEALVYHSGPNGQLMLGAVEYVVPAALWDAGHSAPPMLMGEHFHLNSAIGVYALHAWIWTNNPAGVFEDWNPRVTCP